MVKLMKRGPPIRRNTHLRQATIGILKTWKISATESTKCWDWTKMLGFHTKHGRFHKPKMRIQHDSTRKTLSSKNGVPQHTSAMIRPSKGGFLGNWVTKDLEVKFWDNLWDNFETISQFMSVLVLNHTLRDTNFEPTTKWATSTAGIGFKDEMRWTSWREAAVSIDSPERYTMEDWNDLRCVLKRCLFSKSIS